LGNKLVLLEKSDIKQLVCTNRIPLNSVLGEVIKRNFSDSADLDPELILPTSSSSVPLLGLKGC